MSAKKLTLKQLRNRFLAWAEHALAPATVSYYRTFLGRFIAATGNKQISRVRPADLTAWAKTWHETQAVIRLFAWATSEAGFLKVNPLQSVKLPPQNERKRILAPREMIAFLRSAHRNGRLFLLALRETFARPQEIRLARWDDIQSEDVEMSVDESLACGKALIVMREYKSRRRRTDSNRPRVLLVSRRLGRLLLRLKRKRVDQSGPIFVNSRGKPWTKDAVRCLLRRLRRRLGIVRDRFGEQIVAYTFRHSCATWAASKGLRDRLLADIMGHTETRTTHRYCHLQVSHLREALERLRADRGKLR